MRSYVIPSPHAHRFPVVSGKRPATNAPGLSERENGDSVNETRLGLGLRAKAYRASQRIRRRLINQSIADAYLSRPAPHKLQAAVSMAGSTQTFIPHRERYCISMQQGLSHWPTIHSISFSAST